MTEAEQLVRQLEQAGRKLVLAESCTGGLIAAELAKVPGVSNWLCGSAVTYRSETKSAWLQVDPESIAKHSAVSTEVATQMVDGVLRNTPEADIAAAITGHLGPGAPAGFDGIVFIGTGVRHEANPGDFQGVGSQTSVSRHALTSESRTDRQVEAAQLVLDQLIKLIR